MLYWNYQRVQEALVVNRQLPRDPNVSTEIMHVLEELVQQCANRLGTKFLTDHTEQRVAAQEFYELFLTKCTLEEAEQFKADTNLIMDIEAAIEGITTRALINSCFSARDCPKFFLEPLIAEALLATSVKGLTTADLPDIQAPLIIFLPPGMPVYTNCDAVFSSVKFKALYLAGVETAAPRNALQYTLCAQVSHRLGEPERLNGDDLYTLGLDFPLDRDASLDELSRGHVRDLLHGAELPSDQENLTVLEARLFLNVLLYWKSTDADILRRLNPEWDKINQKVYSTKGKQHEKAVQALKRIPKTEYLHLGSRLAVLQRRQPEYKPSEDQEHAPTGRHQPQHLRRGHWKWQPCGPQNSERKLIFVETYKAGQGPPIERIGFSVRS